MKVFDPRNLVDEQLLQTVARRHPFHPDLASSLKLLTVREKEDDSVRIDLDGEGNATLTIHPIIRPSKRDVYILYHELGHAADRLNPAFGYDHARRLALDGVQESSFLELWNVFIDARLNDRGLFRLPESGEVELVVDGRRYVLPRNDVNTYLLEAAAHLSQRGFLKPGAVVTDIWNHPERRLTFEDLLDLVR
jgi:hypothetical protein